jgi:hypothetical protein
MFENLYYELLMHLSNLEEKSCLYIKDYDYKEFIYNFSMQCFFIGEFSQKIDLIIVILTNTKDFSWEKWSKFAKFRKEKNSNCQIFTISSNR